MGIYDRDYMNSGSMRSGAMAARAGVTERSQFLVRTYAHLLGAILAFVGIEYALLNSPIAEPWIRFSMGGRWSWVIVLAAFMGVSFLANRWASSATSKPIQYAGLSLFVIAEAFLFLPLLYIASRYGGANVIPAAGVVTGIIFAGLSAIVFITRKDFSFMRGALMLCGFVALAVGVCAAIFGFSLGIFFTVAMIGLCAGYILYDTSNVLHHYRTDQHVSASLALFASVALMFYYVLSLFMQLQSNNKN